MVNAISVPIKPAPTTPHTLSADNKLTTEPLLWGLLLFAVKLRLPKGIIALTEEEEEEEGGEDDSDKNLRLCNNWI